MKLKKIASTMLMFLVLGCSGPKQLETRLNNRKTVSLKAEAIKENGQWKVEMKLPAGKWKVVPEEEQRFQIVDGDPISTMRWEVSWERWNQQDKPFRFSLESNSGLPIYISVKYPNFVNQGQILLLGIFGASAARALN